MRTLFLAVLSMLLVAAPPNFERQGVVAGFILATGAGLTPTISKGVLFAQATMYRPAAPPALPATTDDALRFLHYNSGTGFYWSASATPATGDDASLGWVRASGGAVTHVSAQVITLPDPAGETVTAIPLGPVTDAEDTGENTYGDTDVPPEPSPGITIPGNGTVVFTTIGFPSTPNTQSIKHGVFGLRYLPEDVAPTATTLDGGIDDAVTAITVISSAGFAQYDVVLIGTELIRIEAIAGVNWTVTRGWDGTTPAAHSNGAAVQLTRINWYIYPFKPQWFFHVASDGVDANHWTETESLPSAHLMSLRVAVVNVFGDSPWSINPIIGVLNLHTGVGEVASPLLLDYTTAKQISGGPEMLGFQSDVANRVIMGRWVGAETNARVLEDCQGNREWKGPDPDCDQNILMGWSSVGKLSLQGIPAPGGLNIVAWKWSTLAEAIDDTETAWDVASGAVYGVSYPIRVRVDNEIVYITNVAANVLTVSRGEEGTTAAAHSNGAVLCKLGSPEDHPRIALQNDGSGILFTSGAAVSDCRIFRGAAGILGVEAAAGSGGGIGVLEVGDSFHTLFLSGDDTVGIKFGSGAAAGDIQLYRAGTRRLVVLPLGGDSTQAFQVLTSGGTPKLGVDTTNGYVGVGTLAGAPDAELAVGGNAHISVSLTVDDSVDITNDLGVGGGAIIDGAVTLGSTLAVTGAVTLDVVLAVAYGGTGAAVAATARANLGAAASAGITGHVVPLAKLTPGGADGSITYNSEGIVTASVDPT